MKINNLKLIIRQRETIILLAILVVAFFFRVYKLDVFYIFDHDQDLYSWIVKDIWIDHHLRLIGQVTSIEGVFIGPLFYYALIPFFALSGMNPISAAYFAAIMGLLTITSIYYVFQRFFGKSVGLFGAAIYATSLGPVFNDRWVVPTLPTTIWSVWFLYTVFSLIEGKTKSLIVAAILIGLIWHIHIALLPLIPILILAFFMARQKITPKIAIISLLTLMALTTPFWIFELKNHFLQTKSLLFNSGGAGIPLKGMARLIKVIDSTRVVFNDALFDMWNNVPGYLVPVLAILLFIWGIFKKVFSKKQIVIIVAWIAIVMIVQQVTKNPISEYYLSNLTILPILFVALFLGWIWKLKKWKYLALGAVVIYMLINTYLLVTKPEDWHNYKYKLQTVEFIQSDAAKHGYSCISENYINSQLGTAVGFRYLTWWKGLHLVRQESNAPLYTIVIPYDAIDKSRLSAQFHYFGVLLPNNPQGIDASVCNDPKYEPIPLLGFDN